MITQIASNSIREGRAWSRLPTLSEYWIERIRGSADFLGLNYYTSRLVEMAPTPSGENPSWEHDANLRNYVLSEWKQAQSNWLYMVPEGLGDLLRLVHLLFIAQKSEMKMLLLFSPDGLSVNIIIPR